MLKKLISGIVICFAIVISSAMPIAAQPLYPSNIVIQSTYTSRTSTGLSISSNGTATITCQVIGVIGTTTKVEAYAYLQKKTNGTWNDVDSSSQTFNAYKGTLNYTSSNLSKGDYRVKGSYYAYCGSDSENIVGYSATVTH